MHKSSRPFRLLAAVISVALAAMLMVVGASRAGAVSTGTHGNRVVSDDELAVETMALAEKLANGPSVAFRYMKRNLNVAVSGTLSAGLDSEAYGMLRSRASEDHKEAARAFVEKRPPAFKRR